MVSQDGENIIVTDAFGSLTGTIDEEGNYSISGASSSCNGIAVDGTIVGNCVVDEVDCQQVTYDAI